MAIQKLEAAFDEFKAFVAGGAPDLGVPQNIQITKTTFVTPALAIIDLDWTAVEGADGYDVEHEFGNVYAPDMRLVEHVTTNACMIGGDKPFLVAVGGPYTVAVYATQGGKRAPVPGVAVLTVPAYEAPAPVAPPEPAFPTPVAWVQGSMQGNALYAPVLVGPPGAQTTQVQFRHTTDPAVADSGAFTIVIDPVTAAALGLPNKGPVDASGVGGAAAGYFTEIDLEFPGNGKRYDSEEAVVLPSFKECLIGLSFAAKYGYTMAVDTVKATLSYYQG